MGEIYFVVLGGEPTNFEFFEAEWVGVAALGVSTVAGNVLGLGTAIFWRSMIVGFGDAVVTSWDSVDDVVPKMGAVGSKGSSVGSVWELKAV